jgi:hypothetical protein
VFIFIGAVLFCLHDATCRAASQVDQVIFTAITGDVGMLLVGTGLSMAVVMGILVAVVPLPVTWLHTEPRQGDHTILEADLKDRLLSSRQ